jgi:TRAP-type mannitol/chloroaromatic compound transport system permease small subunit
VSSLLLALAGRIDALSTRVGAGAAWLYPLLMLVLLVNVVARYGFGVGSIELEELQWHLFSAAFLLGLAYTYAVDDHVRVDLLQARMGARARAWVELLGALFLLLPFAAYTSVQAFEFFWQSWLLGERSPMPSGLPARWAIKGVMCVALVLLTLQALAAAARSLAALLEDERA